MISTLQSQRRMRRVVPIVVVVWGLLLISAVMIQQVVAQDSGGLKPPFRLIKPANLSAPLSGVPPLPLNAPIVMSETFDSGFTQRYNFNVNDPTRPWHLVNASGLVDTSYTWGRVAGAPLTDTLWNAATNPPGSLPIAAGQPYTKNMQAYAIYGPINMLDYTSAFISMTYVLDTLDGDLFGAAYSTNGTDFTWLATTSGRDPALANRHTDYYPIPANVMRQKQVWIALIFTSGNRDNIDALGVYVEDVVIRALPAFKLYMPITRLDATPTPTPTPTSTPPPAAIYRYFYAFNDESTNNNPDFNRWGGDRTTDVSCGTSGTSTCTYYQALVRGLGNPGNALTLWFQGLNGKGGAGPRQGGVSLSTATNFEYSADLYVYKGQKDAIYGLAFDASSGTFPDSGNPPMDTSVNYYLYQLHMDTTTSTRVATWQVVRVKNGSRETLKSSTIPITLNEGQWHNIKVRQSGSTMEFYLNSQLLGTATYNHDGSWNNDRRRFGLYIDVRSSNSGATPFEFFSDNIAVKDLP